MSVLSGLSWAQVRSHYDDRVRTHELLRQLHKAQQEDAFVSLLLGISSAAGNYSADEHGLGPRILTENLNAQQRVYDLASNFIRLSRAADVPALIRGAGLKHLGISVGSEASCMLNPEICWVANTRTVWAHLLVKHNDDVAKAELALRLYRDRDETSEMAYEKWADIHRTLEVALTRLGEEGQKQAKLDSVEPGSITFLWADAIAAHLYSKHRGYSGVLKRSGRAKKSPTRYP